MKLKVILSPESGGRFSVAVPALPGCYTEGATEAEALANAAEAAGAWLESGNDNPSPFGETPGPEVVREIEL